MRCSRSFKLGNTSDSLSLDSAFVVSSSNLEESVITPTFVPAVSNKPVGSSVLNTPADHLDSVTSQSRSSGVVVNSALVGQEIVVDGEGNFDRSVSHDFSLNLGNLRRNAVNRFSFPAVSGVLSTISINAFLVAFRSRLRSTTRSVFSGSVMITRREFVGIAPVGGIVEPASDDTIAFPMVHST